MKLRGSLKMISVAGCLAVCSVHAAEDAVSLEASLRDQVALLVSHSVYSELETDLKQYKTDVEARLTGKVGIDDGRIGS